MEIIKVGIYLEDISFARALARGLAMCSKGMEITILNGIDVTMNMDITLSSVDTEAISNILIVNSPENQSYLDGPPFRIYKYLECNQFVSALLFVFFKVTGKIIPYSLGLNCSTLAVVSEEGGIGTTITAVSLGKILRRMYGKRCIYLNLCPINDSKKYVDVGQEDNLLKVMYYINSKKEFPIKGFITVGEQLDYINTAVLNRCSQDMNFNILNGILQALDKSGEYDYVILDIGNNLISNNLKSLEVADVILFLQREENCFLEGYKDNLRDSIRNRDLNGRLVEVITLARDDYQGDLLSISKTDNLELGKNYGNEIAAIAKEVVS